MSFKFSLVSLAATLAVLASPLVASANTLTAQNTRNLGSTETNYGVVDKQPISQNQTERNMYQTDEVSPMDTSRDTFTDRNTRNLDRTRTERVIIKERPVNRDRADREVSQKLVPNYIGVGGSNRGAALDSKIGITNRISVRPLAIDNFKSDDEQEGNFAFPITYDFQPVIGKLQPYAGAGVGINTEGSDDVGPMLTAGVDYPISKNLTLNGSVNFDAYGDNDVNGILGIATNIQRR